MLQLRYSPASPFVRKGSGICTRGRLGRPLDPAADGCLGARHGYFPRQPARQGADTGNRGRQFIGSALCCEYLDNLHGGRHLIPAELAARWPVLQLHALADGMMEAAVARIVEQLRRPEALIYQGNLDRQTDKIGRSLDALESKTYELTDAPNLATATLGCALGYLDFRLPQLDWRRGRPALARWETTFAARPSMIATKPHF